MSQPDDYDEEFDRLLYSDTETEEMNNEEIISTCSRKEIGLFLVGLAKVITEALSVGVKVIIDIEPMQYESALSTLSLATVCMDFWRSAITIRNVSTDDFLNIRLSMFTLSRPKKREIVVAVMRDKKKEELQKELDSVLTSSRLIYFMVTRKPPESEITTALYKSNVILDLVRKTLIILDKKHGESTNEFREKLLYVGRVPHEVSLLMPLDTVKTIVKMWTPPPPANADYLHEKPRSLQSLVFPASFKRIIESYKSVLNIENKGSLLLIGLHGSGRKTLARSLAKELSLPAYSISMANILARYVGESEAKLKAFFSSLRARGGLAVFDSVDSIFRKGGSDQVSSNLRSLLFSEMAREDNNFIIVFTTTEDAPQQIFDSPLIGEIKLVMPIPNLEERKQLARIYFKEIAGSNIDKLRKIAKEKYRTTDPDRVLESLYIVPFAESTIGFTPGELYLIMKTVLLPTIRKSVSMGKLLDATRDIIQFTNRDYAARQAKIRMLKDRAVALGWNEIADSLLKVMDELKRVAMEREKEIEKYRLS